MPDMPDLLGRLQTALAERYAVESEIGRGGMATVFLAEDLRHERKVAVKVLHPELAATLGTDRFLREIKIAARLEHPHVLTLIDSGDAVGLPYYVMPYVEGESLSERLEREGPLPIEDALKIASEVADGLDYAHRQGVIHRDIKPSNILVSEGHALIADFGLARAVDAASAGEGTATGLAVGTPKYMSPEQAAGGEVDVRTDVYALGCVLWEMFAGEPPFDGPTPAVILARKATQGPPEVRIVRKAVPPQLENVLAKALATMPVDRFQTAGELAEALEKPELVGRRKPHRKILRRVVDAGLAVILLAAGVWLARAFAGGGAGEQPVENGPRRMPHVVNHPAFDPSGTLLAYCIVTEGATDVRVSEVDDWERTSRIAVADGCAKLQWKSDGSAIVFSGQVQGQPGIFVVPASGGEVDRLDLPFTDEFALSPDGERIAVIFAEAESLAVGPLEVPLDDFQRLLVPGDSRWFLSVDWSRSIDRIATVVRRLGGSEHETITMLSDGADQKTVLGPQGWWPLELKWSPDGRALYFHKWGSGELHRLAISPDGEAIGEAKAIASSGDAVRMDIALSPDGRRLFYHEAVRVGTVVRVAPGPAGNLAAAVVTPVLNDVGDFKLSKDGEWLAFKRDREVYKIPVAGGTAERVTAAGRVGAFDWSPDGRFIAYEAEWRDTMRVWIASIARPSDTGMVDGTAMSGDLAWEGERLVYAEPDLRQFRILENLELWSHQTGDWQPSTEIDVDAAEWTRGARGSSRTLPPIDSIGVAWPGSALVSPDATRLLVRWAADVASLHWWQVDIDDLSLTYIPAKGDLLGWTAQGTGLYWQDWRTIRLQSLADGVTTDLLTLPDSLFDTVDPGDQGGKQVRGCRPGRESDPIEFFCISETEDYVPLLVEDFDPYVVAASGSDGE